ncbi:glucuronate isomerase [bacterium]|nr:glucuronate isomerase [bacterium]
MCGKSFLGDDYLLSSSLAKKLYNDYAKDLPIIDYHCHLSAKDIFENKPIENITKCMLFDDGKGDHYKWRAMRFDGVNEDYITGDKDNYQKFSKWAETLPHLIGNPLYLWTHMELFKYFGVTKELNPNTCKEIYDKTNEILKTLTPRKIIEMSNVRCLCTTDDPIDSLEYHKKLKDISYDVKVLPAFRPDKAIKINCKGYNEWIDKLSEVTERSINNIKDFEEAMLSRIEFFNNLGAKVSDHSVEDFIYESYTIEEIDEIFKKKRSKERLTTDEINKYKTYILVFLGRAYHKYNWAQQYHMGAMRNNSTKMYEKLGPDSGFDSVGKICIKSLSRLFDTLDYTNELPKTILYSLDSNDNIGLITLMGSFGDEIRGKMQLGSAWWFNDHKDGIRKHLADLCSCGVLPNFIGMLTDSRSFLSYVRFDYFRRILSSFIAEIVNNHEYPLNEEYIKKIIEDISYNNAKEYFGFE